MNRLGLCLLGSLAFAAGCNSEGQTLVSMRVTVLNASQIPDGGKWNELLGHPLIEVEYATRRSAGERTLYLYDGRSGECHTVIHAPSAPGSRMVVAWAPCM
jgi:hypothetical protein